MKGVRNKGQGVYGRAWDSVSFAMWSNDALSPVANSPTMSSKRKKAESIASKMMILVDFDGAISTEADS